MSVIKFGMPEAYRRLSVHSGKSAAFEAEYEKSAFEPTDPDEKADKEWLDANAPGWSLDLHRGEERDGWIAYNLRILFVSVAHRNAWCQYQSAKEESREEEMRRKAAQDIPEHERCPECGCRAKENVWLGTARVAQFQFSFESSLRSCEECDFTDAPHSEEILEAMRLAGALVGLPQKGESGWNEEVEREYKLRAEAPPVVTIHVGPHMKSADMVRLLKTAIGLSEDDQAQDERQNVVPFARPEAPGPTEAGEKKT